MRLSARYCLGLIPAVFLVCAACSPVGPDYVSPKFDLLAAYGGSENRLPEQVRQADQTKGENAPDNAILWWQSTSDPVLKALLDTALAKNIDVKLAISRVREARFAAKAVRAGHGLQVTGGVTGSAQREAASDDDGNYEDDLGGSGEIDFGWSPDLWGKQTRENQVAEAAYLEQLYLREDVYRTVISDLIENYITLRGAQQRQKLLRESLALQRKTAQIVQVRRQTGLASELDYARAKAEVSDLDATLPVLQLTIDQSLSAISILVDQQPGHNEADLIEPHDLPEFASAPPIGIPADLLRKRPDIRAAELALIGATAQIGVQTAQLYPDFSLNGAISLGISGFGTGPIVRDALAAIEAAISGTLYDGGVRNANVEIAREQSNQAFLTYRQTLLGAISDVENAISGYVAAISQRDSLIASVRDHQNAFEQSKIRYVQGLSDFLDVLDSQRSLTSSQQALAEAQTSLSIEMIHLYSAVGMNIDQLEAEAKAEGILLHQG